MTEIHYYEHGPRDPTARAASIISLIMENVYFSPRRAIRMQLAGTRDILRQHGTASSRRMTSIVKDPRCLSAQFGLDAVTRQFVLCTKCYCLYPYEPGASPDSPVHPVNLHCTYRDTPGSAVCGNSLWRQQKINNEVCRWLPRRKYYHQVLKSWFGRLLSRKGMEDMIDDRCPQDPSLHPDAVVDDIWSSDVFRGLKDSHGRPFFPAPEGVGRLVFSLAVDGFNPFYNKTAGIQTSSTGIWLVLLNLPPHLRYLAENVVFAGAIPGKPSLNQINHALQLVADDLLEFWDPGVFFSRTYNRRDGGLYQGMLVPLICDLVAASQVIGFTAATTAHNMCSACDLDKDDINVMDRSEWPLKDTQEIRRCAQRWKDADSDSSRQSLFEGYGYRWTALYDLPYWQPVEWTVIDSMHTLDSNLFSHHCRKLFKTEVDVDGGDGSLEDPLPPAKDPHAPARKREQGKVRACCALIISNPSDLLDRLVSFERPVLFIVCVNHNIRGEGHNLVVGTKLVLAKNIAHWVG